MTIIVATRAFDGDKIWVIAEHITSWFRSEKHTLVYCAGEPEAAWIAESGEWLEDQVNAATIVRD